MRPHISQREANYLCTILENESKRLTGLLQKIRELTTEVQRLKVEWKKTGNYQTFQKLRDQQAQLAQLTAFNYLDLSKSLLCNEALIKKYTVLPEKKKGGRYASAAREKTRSVFQKRM